MSFRNPVRAIPVAVALAIGVFFAPPGLAAETKTHSVHRERNADGTVNAVTTGPRGGVTAVDRTRGADGVVDAVRTGPYGGTTVVERTRNPDGTMDKTLTTTK